MCAHVISQHLECSVSAYLHMLITNTHREKEKDQDFCPHTFRFCALVVTKCGYIFILFYFMYIYALSRCSYSGSLPCNFLLLRLCVCVLFFTLKSTWRLRSICVSNRGRKWQADHSWWAVIEVRWSACVQNSTMHCYNLSNSNSHSCRCQTRALFLFAYSIYSLSVRPASSLIGRGLYHFALINYCYILHWGLFPSAPL